MNKKQTAYFNNDYVYLNISEKWHLCKGHIFLVNHGGVNKSFIIQNIESYEKFRIGEGQGWQWGLPS